MYICGSGNDFAVSFSYDFAVGFLNCSDGVVFLFFILNMLVLTFYINNLYSSNIYLNKTMEAGLNNAVIDI